uniref:Uncharacterized protein n=1 Tax=Gouania willdenowi TaxID=441366 RepID=A0A8C5ETL9_GOUWI
TRCVPLVNPPGAEMPTPQAKATAPPPAFQADRSHPRQTQRESRRRAKAEEGGRMRQGDREQEVRVAEKHAGPQPQGTPRRAQRGQESNTKLPRDYKSTRKERTSTQRHPKHPSNPLEAPKFYEEISPLVYA